MRRRLRRHSTLPVNLLRSWLASGRWCSLMGLSPQPIRHYKRRVAFAWVEDGAFLVMRMGDIFVSPPAALWLMGRDESVPHYTVLYYDVRSVSRLYEMSFAEGVWKLWRDAPGFRQRYAG